MHEELNNKVRIGLGTTNIRKIDILQNLMIESLLNGIDFIDCAWRYGNEATIGLLLQQFQSFFDEQKIEIVLQSKVWHSQYIGGINKAVKFCLQKLCRPAGIEGYMLHVPGYNVASTINAWKQLVDCKRNRLINVIGIANFDKGLIKVLHEVSNFKPEFLQMELHVNNMRHDRIKYCKDNNIKIQAYHPFGHLEKNLKCPILKKIAEKYNIGIGPLLICFIINQDIEPIINTTNIELIKSVLKFRRLKLEQKDIDEMMTLNTYDNLMAETLDIDLNDAELFKKTTRQRKT